MSAGSKLTTLFPMSAPSLDKNLWYGGSDWEECGWESGKWLGGWGLWAGGIGWAQIHGWSMLVWVGLTWSSDFTVSAVQKSAVGTFSADSLSLRKMTLSGACSSGKQSKIPVYLPCSLLRREIGPRKDRDGEDSRACVSEKPRIGFKIQQFLVTQMVWAFGKVNGKS